MDEQVDVVVFAVELAEFRAHLRARPPHDPLARVEHLPVQDVPPVLRDEDKVNVETAHDAAGPSGYQGLVPSVTA